MNDRAYLSPGSGFMAVNTASNPGLPVGFFAPPGAAWSEGGLAAYAVFREQAEAMICAAIDVGFTGVIVEDGVTLAVRSGDERPNWSILDDAAVDLFAAQAARIASEAVG